ncbi:MAG: serine hydrolase, partial [[Mycobacterium] stephanolepidis]
MISRRTVLIGGLSAVTLAAVGCSRSTDNQTSPSELASLEKDFGGRVGVFALDTGSGATLGHRANERFLMCSTVKTFIVSAILHRRLSEPGLLDKRIQYAQSDLMEWAPITSQHVAEGMTVSELCDATLRYSDNTGANLLI